MNLRTCCRVIAATLSIAALPREAIQAQQIDHGASPASAPSPSGAATTPVGGWVLTPALAVSTSWDDNVLIKGEGDDTQSDMLNVVNPRVNVDFTGRRGQFAGNYDGAFLLYRDLNSLNSYDQRASASGRRLITPHVALFAHNSLAIVPTTALIELVGVPFERTGSTLDDARGGGEAALSKRTKLVAAYHFQYIDFDRNQFSFQLRGGHSHGAGGGVRHLLSPRTTLTADADFEHALVGLVNDVFDIFNSSVGLEQKVSETVRIYGA